jgi:hypothetical protein
MGIAALLTSNLEATAMVTTYDLESFSKTEFGAPAKPESTTEFTPLTELRLQPVAESSDSLEAKERDFSAVIGAQALASLCS